MNAGARQPLPLLAKGQLWKVANRYVEIVDLGERLAHYKLLRDPEQKAALTHLIRREALAVYLKLNQAMLVESAQPLAA